ncbi:MAG: tRNA pseudouridine(13) synthase TruD, partial [Deltaproteobacteria bacterium]
AMTLPYLTPSIEPIEAEFRSTPEDFEVEEVPVYAPSGTGEHVFALIEKRERTTKDAVRALCETVGADPKAAGWAGLKDRHAVTRQWISIWGAPLGAVMQADVDGVRVLQAALHPHKLRTGHLRANRFHIRLRQIEEWTTSAACCRRSKPRGCRTTTESSVLDEKATTRNALCGG